ncbi:MAG: hypothetical protein ACI9F9_001855 [Candidatus Paceibacteria bacterium]|jgi:hypothetical protein
MTFRVATSLLKYQAWLTDSVDKQLSTWAPTAAADRVEEAQRELTERTTSDSSSRGYADACPVAGVEHEKYRLRDIELPCGASLIAGIHFLGTRVQEPFVGVFAQSQWLEEEALRAAHLQLMEEFKAFTPKSSWWWTCSERDLGCIEQQEVDQHLVAGSLAEIRTHERLELPPEWDFRQLQSVDEIARPFEELYMDFHRARPDLESHVQIAALENLQECADAGGLFCCFEGSDLAGLVAAQPQMAFGVNAWTVWEIVLARPHCGRGLAAPFQRAALDCLDMDKASIVIGTIHAKNLPSLKTALRVGRRIVGRWTFLGQR